jgi:O-antigen/teichoic acid export membrane protein
MLILLKRQAANAWIAAGCVIFNVAVNLYAIPRWGAMGAAWTTMATEVVICIVSVILIFSLKGLTISKAQHFFVKA